MDHLSFWQSNMQILHNLLQKYSFLDAWQSDSEVSLTQQQSKYMSKEAYQSSQRLPKDTEYQDDTDCTQIKTDNYQLKKQLTNEKEKNATLENKLKVAKKESNSKDLEITILDNYDSKDALSKSYEELKLKFRSLQNTLQQEQAEGLEFQRLAVKLSQAISKYDYALCQVQRERMKNDLTKQQLQQNQSKQKDEPKNQKPKMKFFKKGQKNKNDDSDNDTDISFEHKNNAQQIEQEPVLRDNEFLEQVLSPRALNFYHESLKMDDQQFQLKAYRQQQQMQKNSGYRTSTGESNTLSEHNNANKAPLDRNILNGKEYSNRVNDKSQFLNSNNSSFLLDSNSAINPNEKPSGDDLYDTAPIYNSQNASSDNKHLSILKQLNLSSPRGYVKQSLPSDKKNNYSNANNNLKSSFLHQRNNSSDYEEASMPNINQRSLQSQEISKSKISQLFDPPSQVSNRDKFQSPRPPISGKASPLSYNKNQIPSSFQNSRPQNSQDNQRSNLFQQNQNSLGRSTSPAPIALTNRGRSTPNPQSLSQVNNKPGEKKAQKNNIHLRYMDPNGSRYDIPRVQEQKKQIMQEIEDYMDNKNQGSQPQPQQTTAGRSYSFQPTYQSQSFIGNTQMQSRGFSQSYDSGLTNIMRSPSPSPMVPQSSSYTGLNQAFMNQQGMNQGQNNMRSASPSPYISNASYNMPSQNMNYNPNVGQMQNYSQTTNYTQPQGYGQQQNFNQQQTYGMQQPYMYQGMQSNYQQNQGQNYQFMGNQGMYQNSSQNLVANIPYNNYNYLQGLGQDQRTLQR